MLLIPLQPVPNQTVSITLAEQACQINVYQKGAFLFLDLLVSNEPIVTGVICQNLNPVVRDAYLGFSGDLAFIDNEGRRDPEYRGLGPRPTSRFNLAYLTADEVGSFI